MAGVGSEVDGDQIETGRICLPLDQDKILTGGVVRSGGAWNKQSCPATPHGGLGKNFQNCTIDFGDLRVGWLLWPSKQLDRNADFGAGELAFVKESHAGQAKNEQRRGSLFSGRQDRGDSPFVVILEEMRAARNCRWGQAKEMLLNADAVVCNDAVVQGLVVSKIEAEGLEAFLEVPINFGQEQESVMSSFDSGNGGFPKFFGERW